MNTPELVLLAAFVSPVIALVACNAWLALMGERGTLLVPTGGFEFPACSALVLSAAAAARSRALVAALARDARAANDDCAREAA